MNTDRTWFRYALGFVVVLGGMLALAGLYRAPIPATNHDVVVLAIGIILGWGGSVVSFEFGSSPAERKAANTAADAPTGKPDDPVTVTETDTPGAPTAAATPPFVGPKENTP